jgi:hypothetical protein
MPSRLLAALWLALFLLVRVPAAAQESLAIGAAVPEVGPILPDAVTGAAVDFRESISDDGTVVVFWGNQCVWSDRYEERLKQALRQARIAGIEVLLVNSNDPRAFPKEGIEDSRPIARRLGVDHYLADVDGSVARALGARRIPHAFVFDGSRRLVYSGAIDDSPGDASLVQNTYLLDALEALASGTAPDPAVTPPFGCRIKL